MVPELLAVGAVPAATYLALRENARRRLHKLAAEQPRVIAEGATRLALPAASSVVLPSFAGLIAAVTDVLPPAAFALAREAAARTSGTERSYVPRHKRGGTVSYEALHALAPELVALYHSPYLVGLCAATAGARLVPTPVHDQSSCSLLVYDRPGDHIGWHYDYNFYDGRHFTALLSLVNEGPAGLSSARLVHSSTTPREVPTPPNTLVLFEGARVRHMVTRLGEAERRIVLSMTYCTSQKSSAFKRASRRVKDTAYFGLRALWT